MKCLHNSIPCAMFLIQIRPLIAVVYVFIKGMFYAVMFCVLFAPYANSKYLTTKILNQHIVYVLNMQATQFYPVYP